MPDTHLYEGDQLLPTDTTRIDELLAAEQPEPEEAEEDDAEPSLDDKLAELAADPKDKAAADEKAGDAAEADEPAAVDVLIADIDAMIADLEKVETPAKTEAKPAADPEPEPEEEPDDDLKALLEHDDPAVQSGAKALVDRQKKLDARLEKVEGHLSEQAVAAQAATFDDVVDAVGKMCDPPLNEDERELLVYRLTDENKGREPLLRGLLAAAAQKSGTADLKRNAPLAVGAGVQMLMPGRLKATNGKTGTDAKKASEGSRPVVRVKTERPEKGTIMDRGGSAAAKPTPETVPANETLDAAIARGMRKHWRG